MIHRDHAVVVAAVVQRRDLGLVHKAHFVARLREAGVSAAEALDLVLSTALFGWANRLMHVLGDPLRSDGEAEA